MTLVARVWTPARIQHAPTSALLAAHGDQVAALRQAGETGASDKVKNRLVTRVYLLRIELRHRGALRVYPDAPELEG